MTASLEAVNQPLQVRPVRVLAEGQEPGSRAAVSYSITSSARSKSEVGSSMLRARAVVARPQVHPARPRPWQLQIIRRCDRHRFVALPKRWIVERTRMDQPLPSARPRLRTSRT